MAYTVKVLRNGELKPLRQKKFSSLPLLDACAAAQALAHEKPLTMFVVWDDEKGRSIRDYRTGNDKTHSRATLGVPVEGAEPKKTIKRARRRKAR